MPSTLPPTPRRLAWLHLANDFTLDFITPLLPAGVGAAWLGLMEGLADGIGQVLKLFTGRASDASGRRVPWVRAGYVTNAVARPLIGVGLLVAWPWWIVACRVVDRVGKGVRGSATDALVADWTHEDQRAGAYAWMRIMDQLGATLGALAVTACAYWFADCLGWVVCGLVAVTLWVVWLCRGLEDAPRTATPPGTPAVGWWPRGPELRRPLAALSVAALAAKLSPLLVLVQVAGLGGNGAQAPWPLWQVCLGWTVLGLVQMGAAAAAGALTGRLGPVVFLRCGWLAGTAVFITLAVAHGPWLTAAGVAYGVLVGLTEGAEKTWLASLAPRHERAVAFGAMALLSAGASLAGNALCGALLATHASAVFLCLAAALALGALLTVGLGRVRPNG